MSGKDRKQKWWVHVQATGQIYGPISQDTLYVWIAENRVTAVDFLAEVGSDEWTEIGEALLVAPGKSGWGTIPLAKALAKLGDRRGCDLVARILFGNPGEEPKIPLALVQNLFGDIYGPLIVQACTFEKRYYGNLRWDYKLEKSDAAVRRLCSLRSRVSANLLILTTEMRDVTGLYEFIRQGFGSSDDYGPPSTVTLSFQAQRDRARIELGRRGNPSYDPAVYLDPNGWR